MKGRYLVLVALALLTGCPEPAKLPPPPRTEVPTAPPPPTEPTSKPTTTAPPTLASGTRLVLANRTNDEVWDKMMVAGGRLWVLTNLSRWTDGPMYVPASRLWSVPIAGGGTLTHHLDLEGMGSLAADDHNVYVAVNRDLSKGNATRTGRVLRISLEGGVPTNVVTGLEPRLIAVDADSVWVDDVRLAKDGGKPASPSGVKDALALALDDDNVYFSTAKGAGTSLGGDAKGGRVFRVAKKGGAPIMLANKLPDEPGGLAVDATHVYFCAVTWSAEQAGIVARVPKGGGDVEILAKDQPAVRKTWVSGDHVYFLSGRGGRPSSILRVAKTGGPVETVVSDSTLEQAAMDATSLYFSSDGVFKPNSHERTSPAALVRFVK